MKHPFIRSRRMRYGGMTVYLTVTLVAVIVLINVIFSALANYYIWYIDMTPEKLYSVSELCYELLGDQLDEASEDLGKAAELEILFCENPEEYEVGEAGHYIYTTAKELEQKYPDHISVDWFDCWVEPTRARELGVTDDAQIVLMLSEDTAASMPSAAEDQTTANTKRVFRPQEFFVFEGTNTTSPVGYDGERIFATTMSSMLFGDRPTALFTQNHEEVFFDTELVYLLRDAGYNINFIDLYYNDIPEDCDLLVIYNPNNDFVVADGVSEIDELDKLSAYLADGGDLMVFLSASSPELPAFESFLADWGVSIGRMYDQKTGHPYNAMVKDTSLSLTADGFTIIADYSDSQGGQALTQPMRDRGYTPRVVFSDATVLLPAEGFTASGEGSYTRGDLTRSDVFVGSDNAEAWACGSRLAGYDTTLPLLTVTTNGTTGARLMVCSSVEFAAEARMQSAVFGNSDALLCVMEDMGLEHTMIGLRYKPFTSSTISSITTSQMLRWTLALTITPAVLILAVATFVLVRRKYS